MTTHPVNVYRDPSDSRLYYAYHKIRTGERHPTRAEVSAALERFLQSERRAKQSPENPKQ